MTVRIYVFLVRIFETMTATQLLYLNIRTHCSLTSAFSNTKHITIAEQQYSWVKWSH